MRLDKGRQQKAMSGWRLQAILHDLDVIMDVFHLSYNVRAHIIHTKMNAMPYMQLHRPQISH